MIKRTVDIIVATVGVLIYLPFLPFICFSGKLGKNAPLFAVNKRIGKDGKIIKLRKFNPAVFRLSGSSTNKYNKLFCIWPARMIYYLKFNKWLLLFKVLKGDMSLIGPRAEKPQFVTAFRGKASEVLTVRPGIWGPYDLIMQEKDLSPRHRNHFKTYREHILPKKLAIELQYVKDKRFGKDLRLVGQLFMLRVRTLIDEQLMKQTGSRNFLLPVDLVLVFLSYFLSFQLRFDWLVPRQEYIVFLTAAPLVVIIRIASFYAASLYKNLWKYIGIEDLLAIVSACTFSSIFIIALVFLVGINTHSRSIFLIDWMLCLLLVGGSRLVLRLFSEKTNVEAALRKYVLIVGAGDVGEMLIRELRKNWLDQYNVVSFVDDDPAKQGKMLHGVKVIGACRDIPKLVPALRIDEVLITVSNISSEGMKLILKYCKEADVRHRVVPAMNDLVSGSIRLAKFRKVEISDLFGREAVNLDFGSIRKFIENKILLITGAGGSIGSELCRQIVSFNPGRLIMIDKNANYLHEIQTEIRNQFPGVAQYYSLTDCTNKRKIEILFGLFRPHIVFHAAAQKHVPIGEQEPEETIWNNVQGTKITAHLANKYGADKYVLISTDKAVNPTSIMGASKRVAELYLQSIAQRSKTKFATVRFGNVLNSNGSVVPLFMKQIENGGPVTVTHPGIERFFMSIAEAVQLVLQAATMVQQSEIFFLEMGKSIKIVHLAEELIKQAGLKPNEDIKIRFTGLRPGEKMFEELRGQNEEALNTFHQSIKVLKSNSVSVHNHIARDVQELVRLTRNFDRTAIKKQLRKIVPEYMPPEPLIQVKVREGLEAVPPAIGEFTTADVTLVGSNIKTVLE